MSRFSVKLLSDLQDEKERKKTNLTGGGRFIVSIFYYDEILLEIPEILLFRNLLPADKCRMLREILIGNKSNRLPFLFGYRWGM